MSKTNAVKKIQQSAVLEAESEHSRPSGIVPRVQPAAVLHPQFDPSSIEACHDELPPTADFLSVEVPF